MRRAFVEIPIFDGAVSTRNIRAKIYHVLSGSFTGQRFQKNDKYIRNKHLKIRSNKDEQGIHVHGNVNDALPRTSVSVFHSCDLFEKLYVVEPVHAKAKATKPSCTVLQQLLKRFSHYARAILYSLCRLERERGGESRVMEIYGRVTWRWTPKVLSLPSTPSLYLCTTGFSMIGT